MTDTVEPAVGSAPDATVDNRGTSCIKGITLVHAALEDLPDGAVLAVRTTDKRAERTYTMLDEKTPHELLDIETKRRGLIGNERTVYIRVRHP